MAVRDIRREKNAIRGEMKALRRGFSFEEKERRDQEILKRFLRLSAYERAEWIFPFVSTAIEVDTLALIRRSLGDGKRVAVPRCTPGKVEMFFYEICSLDELKPGAFGVLEPRGDESCKIMGDANTLLVLPGLAFDMDGYRLGYGKGYYDRFLSAFPGVKAGVCYTACLKQALPHGRYDKRADYLVTEKFIKQFTHGQRGKHDGRK